MIKKKNRKFAGSEKHGSSRHMELTFLMSLLRRKKVSSSCFTFGAHRASLCAKASHFITDSEYLMASTFHSLCCVCMIHLASRCSPWAEKSHFTAVWMWWNDLCEPLRQLAYRKKNWMFETFRGLLSWSDFTLLPQMLTIFYTTFYIGWLRIYSSIYFMFLWLLTEHACEWDDLQRLNTPGLNFICHKSLNGQKQDIILKWKKPEKTFMIL